MDTRHYFHPETTAHWNRRSFVQDNIEDDDSFAAQSTPRKRERQLDDVDLDVTYDDGYYSLSPRSTQSYSYSHSPVHNTSHARYGETCMSLCPERSHRIRCCCRRDDVAYTPRRSVHNIEYEHRLLENSLYTSSHQHSTPKKNSTYIPRRCFTETKNHERAYFGHIAQPQRPRTCVKPRKELQDLEADSDCYYDLPRRRMRSRRNLYTELNAVESSREPVSREECLPYSTNGTGGRIQPCDALLFRNYNEYKQDTFGSKNMSMQEKQDITPPPHRAPDPTRSCNTCFNLQQSLLRMANSAYSNIRRKTSSSESFHQFKSELDLTNEFLQQTLVMLNKIKAVCGH